MNAVTPTAPDTPKNPFDDLAWVCTALCELLEIENAALDRYDAQTVRELTENKNALGKLYEKTLMSLAPDAEPKPQMTKEQLAELHRLGQRLSQLMERNALMLKAGIEARKRVMDVFVNAAKEQNQNTIHYGKRGNFNALPVSRERAALAYNNTL